MQRQVDITRKGRQEKDQDLAHPPPEQAGVMFVFLSPYQLE
jgi:hypothetical protein